jgi:DNA-binding YbaB/EbfC family protein
MDLMGMMKKAQALQAEMERVQTEIETFVAEGKAGGGLVAVTLRGRGALVGVQVDPSLLSPDNSEILTDLLVAAHADARSRLEAMVQARTEQAAGQMQAMSGLMPGLFPKAN